VGERNAQKEILKKRGDRGRRPLGVGSVGFFGVLGLRINPAVMW